MVFVKCASNGCSLSKKQLSIFYRKSFPKRLLVATSILVIITMCLIPSEARNVPHKLRHRSHRSPYNRQMESLCTCRGPTGPKLSKNNVYYNATRKIITRLKNTRRYINEDRNKLGLDDMKKYKNKPSWLPTVNFVQIHFFNYTDHKAARYGSSIPERRFKHVMPKLYKSLVEYQELFEQLLHVKTNFSDDPINHYKLTRNISIENTLIKLRHSIEDVKDFANITDQPFKKKLDLSSLQTVVNKNQCSKNDYIAFRGYYNLINNWHMELRCPRGKNEKKMCSRHEEKMVQKLKQGGNKLFKQKCVCPNNT